METRQEKKQKKGGTYEKKSMKVASKRMAKSVTMTMMNLREG